MYRHSKRIGLLLLGLLLVQAGELRAQTEFKMPEFHMYESFEWDADRTIPTDWQQPGEFITARLMYPSGGGFGRRGRGGRGDWQMGGTTWSVDYPDGDRTFVQLLRRFTTINTRSVEQAVNPDDPDSMGFFPFMVVGLPGYWNLTDEQAKNIRNYLLKGGFLLADSFFGSEVWPNFAEGIKRIFPEYPIVDLDGSHPVFHTVYDIPKLAETQIPNMNSLLRGGGGWLSDGREPHWRGVIDDKGRLLILIAFNNDVWDSLQWADDPRYPSERMNLGLRIATNIAVYALTH
ncbi:MAG TPA: DUF4159 domain-containing protein [Candidatus Acidoferrum sp.]|nr:DUF4159 domain-containing protein [Candidatus Acidoferrum sp.]